MMFLFGMECRKTARSILYWVLVLVLLVVCLSQYESMVESELSRADDPNSVFYIASDGGYAEEQDSIPDEAMERAMMTGATNRLIDSYRNNRYEYYPFGYVKVKTMSAQGQAAILRYLMELTGLGEQEINGTAEGTEDTHIGDVPVSGGGAFILEPGKGEMDGNGQFVAEPEDWKYVSGEGNSSETSPHADGSFEMQVSFERFREIMEEVNRLIGRNSYFSQAMLNLYYFGNDCEDTPITQRQHQEFYEDDQVTGAFARYYCDSISTVMLFLPAFVMVDLMLRDKRRKMQGLTYPRTISSAKLICIRYAATVCMVMLTVLILPIKSLSVLMRYCSGIGVSADALAFVKYSLAWLLPTVLLVMAVSLLVTVLLENYTAILLTGVIWLIGRPSVDKIAGGNYGLFDLIIRHNTLKGYGRMMENIRILTLNRIAISIAAFALVGLSVLVYGIKRKGGLSYERREPAHNHSIKFTSEC